MSWTQGRAPDSSDITHSDVFWPFPSPLSFGTPRDTFSKCEVRGHLPSLVFTLNSLRVPPIRETFFCLLLWFRQCEKAKACKISPEVGGGPLQRCAFFSAWPKVKALSPVIPQPKHRIWRSNGEVASVRGHIYVSKWVKFLLERW